MAGIAAGPVVDNMWTSRHNEDGKPSFILGRVNMFHSGIVAIRWVNKSLLRNIKTEFFPHGVPSSRLSCLSQHASRFLHFSLSLLLFQPAFTTSHIQWIYELREIFISFRESIPINHQTDILFPLGLLCPPSLSFSLFMCCSFPLHNSYVSSFCFTFASCYIYNALLPEATM